MLRCLSLQRREVDLPDPEAVRSTGGERAMIRTYLVQGLMLLLLAVGGPAVADDADALDGGERAAIRNVIEAQLAAFRDDDGARAFAFASPAIQREFGTPGEFLAMVRDSYMPVYRPREVRFRELAMVRGEPVQIVLLVGPDLEVVHAFYLMQKQADGSWRINGCMLEPASDEAL
jgi:hypothetical protein